MFRTPTARTALRAAAALGGLGLWGCGAAPGAPGPDAGGSARAVPARPATTAAHSDRGRLNAAQIPPSTTCWVHATFDRPPAGATAAARAPGGLRMLAVARICVRDVRPEPPG